MTNKLKVLPSEDANGKHLKYFLNGKELNDITYVRIEEKTDAPSTILVELIIEFE